MCARRFLIALFVLILVAVAGAFAIYQWGGQMLVKQAVPRGHFEAAAAGGGPDYRAAENWIARPDLPQSSNPSLWRPSNWPPPTLQSRPAATFYIHPTTYLQRDRWNAPVDHRESAERAALFVRSQASAFNDVSQVWAPRYRQAAYGAFLLKSQDAQKALDLAYADVRAAFEQFLRANSSGPIILAGHSQGALHLLRLLTDRKDAIGDRLVAAYVVGWPLSASADLTPLGRRACSHPEASGCILSWQSFAEPANPELVLGAWVGTRGPTGVRRVRRDMVCVNPLTGTSDGKAPPSANPGTLVPTADMSQATIEPGRVGAHCRNGLLILDGSIPPLGPFVLPGNNYHVYDYALFWGAIRRDAEQRLTAWQKR